jgi:uncharacterized surface protein with fasciclin (FAS1) repeats
MIDYTKYFKMTFRYTVLGLFTACLFVACKRTEFMPAPVGEPIVYADSSLYFSEYMRKSPSYSFFWQAWQRSGIEKVLKAYDPNYAFSVFMPDNSAMEAAGLNSEKIRSTPIGVLDSMMRLHIVPKKLYPEPLVAQLGNLELITLLSNLNYVEKIGYLDYAYRYRQYLTIENGAIYLNGQHSGLSSTIRIVKEASIFPINRVLKKPAKSTRQVLFEDGRFKMYLGIRRYNDSLYNALYGVEETYLYTTPYENRYTMGVYTYPKSTPMLDFLSSVNYAFNTFTNEFDENNSIYHTTLLAPTDDAFKRAGFKDLDDLIALNERAIPFINDIGVLSGYLPTDSILNNHYWQSNNVAVPLNSAGQQVAIIRPPNPLMILYTNDLRNEIMKDYTVNFFSSGNKDYSLYNNLDFIRDGETLRTRVRGSQAEAATFVQKNIETFNGVIHVLDRLLLPPGFKLH